MNRRQLLKNSATTFVGMMALPGLSVFLKSCAVDNLSDYRPAFLSMEQFHTVWQMAELILPKTDSPGASDARVAPYIDLLFNSYFEEDEKTRLESGLIKFMDNCQQQYGTSFISMNEEKQLEFMQKTEVEPESNVFFKSFKGITLWAFFTSEVGMKSMNYNPVPGKYDGCIYIDENEKLLVGNS